MKTIQTNESLVEFLKLCPKGTTYADFIINYKKRCEFLGQFLIKKIKEIWIEISEYIEDADRNTALGKLLAIQDILNHINKGENNILKGITLDTSEDKDFQTMIERIRLFELEDLELR